MTSTQCSSRLRLVVLAGQHHHRVSRADGRQQGSKAMFLFATTEPSTNVARRHECASASRVCVVAIRGRYVRPPLHENTTNIRITLAIKVTCVTVGHPLATLGYAATDSACGTCLTISISISIVTSSPTSTPPVSSATFQVKPQSLRLIFVVALKPALIVPQGDLD
ncbi:MAG: hypothetical protein KatS3mg054_0384 [Chloroflexus sp.]|nr:MAG: hypothetical protein KatS3mg054_0384 [Chloroflexus sp.]